MLKNIVLFCCLVTVICYQQASAQSPTNNANTKVTMAGGMLTTFDLAEKGMEGPMHLLDEFSDAVIVWKVGGDSSVISSGNYQLYIDKLVYLDKEKELGLDFERVKLFKLQLEGEMREFVHTSLLSDTPFEGKTSFLEKIYQEEAGKVSIWRYWFINEVPPNYNEAMQTGSKNTMLKRRNQLVLLRDNQWSVNFKLKKSQIKDVFGDRSQEIMKYIKSNDLDDSRQGLIDFGAYVNSFEW